MHILFWALASLVAVVAPTSLVNTFVGSSGTQQGGPIDTFPGADVPFGMLQWSPDTPSQNAGGGYEYNDKEITGFSLTHLSGPGCNVFGDFASFRFPVLPRRRHRIATFSHASEQAARMVRRLARTAVRAELTVTSVPAWGVSRFPPRRMRICSSTSLGSGGRASVAT